MQMDDLSLDSCYNSKHPAITEVFFGGGKTQQF